jgi:hypothetical protein
VSERREDQVGWFDHPVQIERGWLVVALLILSGDWVPEAWPAVNGARLAIGWGFALWMLCGRASRCP